jgi:hypothetical protein
VADLGVEQALGQALHVDGFQVQQRRAEGRGHGVRQVGADTAPEPVSSAMKLVRLLGPCGKMSSAAFWPQLSGGHQGPPRPGKAMDGGSLIAVIDSGHGCLAA